MIIEKVGATVIDLTGLVGFTPCQPLLSYSMPKINFFANKFQLLIKNPL